MNNTYSTASPLVWSDLAHALSPYSHESFLFLTPGDEQAARGRNFINPKSVIAAHIQGDTESTYDIQLVYVDFDDNAAYAGNPAYIRMRQGWRDDSHAVFAPTAHAGKLFSKGDDSECLLLPMLRYPPHHTVYTRNQAPRLGTGNNVTTFMASQAHWKGDYGPPSAAALQPLVHHCRKHTVRFLFNHNGNHVLGATGQKLRDFDHILPRRISSEVSLAANRWLIAYWMCEDPRVTYEDILDRMASPLSQTTLNISFSRWREENNVMSARNNRHNLTMDCKAIQGLTIAQLENNTTWELNAMGTQMRRRNAVEPGVWYELPYIHSDSTGPDSTGLMVTPRVSAAFAHNNRNTHTAAQPGALTPPATTMTTANSMANPPASTGNMWSTPAPATNGKQPVPNPNYTAMQGMGVSNASGLAYPPAYDSMTFHGANHGHTTMSMGVQNALRASQAPSHYPTAFHGVHNGQAMSTQSNNFLIAPSTSFGRNGVNQGFNRDLLDPALRGSRFNNSTNTVAAYFPYQNTFTQGGTQYQTYGTATAGYYPPPGPNAYGNFQPGTGELQPSC